MKRHHTMAITFCLWAALAGCGKSGGELEQERIASEAARQQAIANSLAEEREKDREMREAAAAAASEEVARVAGGSGERRTEISAAENQSMAATQEAESADALRRYTELLRRSVSDPGALQVRNVSVAPKQNGMCAEFSARDKAGVYAGFKRVIVTDDAVSPEEPPIRDTLTKFLAFQDAARDTGCFPDVLNVHVAR